MASAKLAKFTINYIHLKDPDFSEYASDAPNKYGHTPLDFHSIQNYNPVYSLFFKTSDSNYNHIGLNSKYHISGDNAVTCTATGMTFPANVHYKFAPLLDHFNYLKGYYGALTEKHTPLPTFDYEHSDETFAPFSADYCVQKINSANNAAYVDGFFYYLSSQMMHNHGCVNGIDFYGSYVGVQKLYKFSLWDDMYEELYNFPFFHENIERLFYVNFDDSQDMEVTDHVNWSRGHKTQLFISDEPADDLVLDATEIDAAPVVAGAVVEDVMDSLKADEDVVDAPPFPYDDNDSVDSEIVEDDPNDADEEEEEEEAKTKDDEGLDTKCKEGSGSGSGSEYESDMEEEEEDSKLEEDMSVDAYIRNFPVHMICIEKCEGLLGTLLDDSATTDEMCIAYMMQIIMTLIIYQKAFKFTHNDLHDNNVMYVSTDQPYIYYKHSGVVYRVPTYGKIFKIIDFGRAIYRYRGKLMCSNSYGPKGEAEFQYNTEPYFNPNARRIDPNFSFDLCRLATSIYDGVIYADELPKFRKTIQRWCKDDAGRNVYMKPGNREERYPGFKLYVMIARTVHKHTPHAQLQFPEFRQFAVHADAIADKPCVDIDSIPAYYI